MKIHMLNGAPANRVGLPQYPTPETMVNANGNNLGNGGGFGPGSNKSNPYAHAQPGMYAGGNTLTGVKPQHIMNMTIKDVLEKVPEIMQAIANNPKALAALASFADSKMVNGRPGLRMPSTQGFNGFNGFKDILDDNEAMQYMAESKTVRIQDENASEFKAELIKDASFSTIYRLMQTAATVANRSSTYTHTMPDNNKKTFENPHITVEKIKLGRKPNYNTIMMTLTSDNHPPVNRTFWVIDARKHAPDYAVILISAEDGTESWKLAREFADDIYVLYHNSLRGLLDRFYFDSKYGWPESQTLSQAPQLPSATPGVRYFKKGEQQ